MARLIAALIRHGDYHQAPDTPSAHQPYPLTAKGRAQASEAGRLLARQLASEGWRLAPEIDSSELLRAWQTATLMTEQLAGGTVCSFADLAERGLGSAANLTIEQVEAAVRQDPRCGPLPSNWKSNSHFRLPLPGAESLMAAGERVARHLVERMAALAVDLEADTVKVFVGHGAAFRHAAHHLGVLNLDDIARLSMHHARPVFLEFLPATVAASPPYGQWRQIGGEWKVRRTDTCYTD